MVAGVDVVVAVNDPRLLLIGREAVKEDRKAFKKKMGKLRSKLSCCFGSTKDVVITSAQDGNAGGGAAGRSSSNGHHAPTALVNGDVAAAKSKKNKNKNKRVTIREDSARMQSPTSDVLSTGSSCRSSVYFDASLGGDDDWKNLDEFGEIEEDFITHQVDGQYFFNAKDDPTLSKEAFEGIHMYPPLPTTEPDPIPPRSPITVSNMDTLLHTYQHEGDDEKAKQSQDEAEIAAEKAGVAMEHQAQIMMLGSTKNASYYGESTNQLLKDLNMKNVREKGFPGELTESELEAVKLFQSELKKRDPIYNEIVRSLSIIEKEAYALCRWLRARKFDVEKVFELLDEAREHYAKAKGCDFYPDLEKELGGVSRSIFLSQYPAVFSGNAKNGCPVMYLKCGSIQPDGMKCIVSFEKLDRYFWNDIMYCFPTVLKDGQTLNPNFVRTENITVYDLKGVSRSQITSDTFEMIKVGNRVMSSFPETLHCLLIINAPSWFGFVWSVIKRLIDPRTAAKIEVFTSSKAGNKRMLDLIDNSQIPSCYGGTGLSLAEAAAGSGSDSPDARSKMVVINELLNIQKKNSEKTHSFELDNTKPLTLTIWTRCKAGATAGLFKKSGDNETLVTEIDISGENKDEPYSRTLGAIVGPGSFTVKIKSKTDPGAFLLLGSTSP